MLVVLGLTPIMFVVLKQARVDVGLSHVIGEWNKQESYANADGFCRTTDVSQNIHHGVGYSSCLVVFLDKNEVEVMDRCVI